MGGLVARSYLRQFGDPARIDTFVSIATPHHGTWMAMLGLGDGVKDMRPGSKFLVSIDADAARFSTTRWVTIRTPLDLMIVPSTSSVLPWARNYEFPVLAHPLLVLDDRVLDCLLRALGSDPISTKSVRAPRASRHAESPQPQSPGTPPLR
jgi:triacylglycerol lipase